MYDKTRKNFAIHTDCRLTLGGRRHLSHGSAANRQIGKLAKVAIQSIWWLVMGKGKVLAGVFAGQHFDREIIVLCVRWYLRHKLSQSA
jgi:hypothetical protein